MGLLYASYVCVGVGFKICVWGGGGVWNGPIVCKLCVGGRGLRCVCVWVGMGLLYASYVYVGEGFKMCVCVGWNGPIVCKLCVCGGGI